MQYSKAGKEILIKAATQAIPSYCMTTFVLLSMLLDEIHNMLNKFFWGKTGYDRMCRRVNWLRWEKLCVRNEAGGRGFWDLHLFNLTLLGKMAWRLTLDQDSLVCRVLKACYFSNGDFFTAKIDNNSSYTWSSIFASQDLLKQGIRWKVGDDKSISIWRFPWIDDEKDFFIRSPCPIGFEHGQVADLVKENTNLWDDDKRTVIFSQNDIFRIKKSLLSPSGVEDELIWHFTKDGRYSVKSRYNLAVQLAADRNLEVDGNWKLLWASKVPPRVRDFLWRACRGCLPTKENMFAKKIVEDKWCVLCEKFIETH